jgi:hypothetical protein
MVFVVSLAVAVFLAGAAIGVIAVIIAGVRSEDRAKNLANAPRSRTEAATRRALGVGVRNAGADRDEHDGE